MPLSDRIAQSSTDIVPRKRPLLYNDLSLRLSGSRSETTKLRRSTMKANQWEPYESYMVIQTLCAFLPLPEITFVLCLLQPNADIQRSSFIEQRLSKQGDDRTGIATPTAINYRTRSAGTKHCEIHSSIEKEPGRWTL
jgi:hypothetical protein